MSFMTGHPKAWDSLRHHIGLFWLGLAMCGLVSAVSRWNILMIAVCFWSTFTALSVQLFYWSVWKLGKYPSVRGIADAQHWPDLNWHW
jgi:hypothetical protein